MTCLIPFIITIALLYIGGWLRGLFEAVVLFDSVDDWLGPYWAFVLFASDKDRNKDGKVTFMELNFPNDGGHRAKLFELLCYSFSILFFAVGAIMAFHYIPKNELIISAISLITPFILWWFISIGFLTSFNKYRPKK